MRVAISILLLMVLSVNGIQDHSSHSNNNIRDNHRHQHELLHFEKFMRDHNRVYNNDIERERRFDIFQKNLKKIDILNEHEQGTAKYGITKFTDMSEEEFSRMNGLRREMAIPDPTPKKYVAEEDDIPEAFDWRDHGAVTPVKDQGFCGSCWAFSVTGNIESLFFNKTGTLLPLSEQELVDCDKTDGGCGGGWMTNAYKAVQTLGGLEDEKDYPYEGYLSEGCHFNKTLVKFDIDGYIQLPSNETLMAHWLAKNNPISIGINANVMQFYMRGVSHPPRWLCKSSMINHGVLIVGYGMDKTRFTHKPLPYWIVKNSWGKSYGRKGYYYVYRGDGTCGINTMATSAVLS